MAAGPIIPTIYSTKNSAGTKISTSTKFATGTKTSASKKIAAGTKFAASKKFLLTKKLLLAQNLLLAQKFLLAKKMQPAQNLLLAQKFLLAQNLLLRTLSCGNDELPLLTCISRVLFISLGSLGTNSKRSSKNTPKFHLIPAYWEKKTQIYVEKINSTTRSISKFIFLIYFSIKITIKE